METFYKHYIIIDGRDRIVDGFSNAFRQPSETDICINEQGGYQFRLFRNGEENPPLFDGDGVPLYTWNGHKAIKRSSEEIDADRPSLDTTEGNDSGYDIWDELDNAYLEGVNGAYDQ